MEVKICGTTTRDDALLALDAGADYLGFVLYPDSPRGITPLAMACILDGIDRPCRAVPVCVNMPRAEVEKIVADCALFAVQLHGDERPEEFAAFGMSIWRAVKLVGERSDPNAAVWPAERFVVDAAVPGMYGGTGVTADWDAAQAFSRRRSTMLAGGLTPENVSAAVERVQPLGVDVASGIEAQPGRKDPDKVREFIARAKGGESGG